MEAPIAAALIAAAGAVLAAVFAWRSSSRATDVNQQAANLGWVKELRQDAIDAREEVELLRGRVRELSRQLDAVTREADHWISEHQAMRRHAWRPGMTLERLRELIGPVEPPPATANGH